MRILDPFEVAMLELWPLWDLADRHGKDKDARATLNAVERTAYIEAIEASRFGAILNEKLPPVTSRVEMPESFRFDLRGEESIYERTHPDVRIARRAETIARLAAVARERGEVTDGLRRVLVIQGIRLTYLASVRLAEAEGKPPPDPSAINATALVGSLLEEASDAPSEEQIEREEVSEKDVSV
jgi:hypothetical protein